MKIFTFVLLFASVLRASELNFEVVALDGRVSKSEAIEVMLSAYDAFYAAAKVGVLKPAPGDPLGDIPFKDVRIMADADKLTLAVDFPGQHSAPELRLVENALLSAALRQQADAQEAAVEKLKERFEALKRNLDEEKDPMRRKVLENLILATVPPLDGQEMVRLRVKR